MPTRNVVLTTRQEKLIETLVESGRYQNASEVLRDGLRLVEQREAEDATKLKRLREAARVGVAALTSIENGICAELRLVVGAVSPKPVRLEKAETMARGEKLTPQLVERIASDASSRVEPTADLRGTVDYKRHLVHVLALRALSAAQPREGTY